MPGLWKEPTVIGETIRNRHAIESAKLFRVHFEVKEIRRRDAFRSDIIRAGD